MNERNQEQQQNQEPAKTSSKATGVRQGRANYVTAARVREERITGCLHLAHATGWTAATFVFRQVALHFSAKAEADAEWQITPHLTVAHVEAFLAGLLSVGCFAGLTIALVWAMRWAFSPVPVLEEVQ